MFYLLAPPLTRKDREPWIRNQIERHHFNALLVESPQGERELVRADFQGEIIRYNEHNQLKEAKKLAEDMRSYTTTGLLSDGGTPCIGDPGSELVREIHRAGVAAQSLGLNSYVLAAIALSGCDGNRFQFHGYPPKEQREFDRWLSDHLKNKATQCFIETPYRMKNRMTALVKILEKKNAWLSFSEGLGTKEEKTTAGRTQDWKKNDWIENLPAKPLGVAVFQLS